MTCAVLTIGTELTRGELRDRNGGNLAEWLTDLGHHVTELSSVDDDDARIINTLRRLAYEHDFVVCTGGLGPTTDDRTSACAARALGVHLERHPKAHEALVRSLSERGRVVTPASEKQADFPRGAHMLENVCGTAPGFEVTIDRCAFFFMPGVPLEMEAMFESQVVPRLPPAQTLTVCLRLRTFGLPEVDVNDRLAEIESKFGVLLGYRASHSEIEVKVIAQADSAETKQALDARARRCLDYVKTLLADVTYAEGKKTLPEALGELLHANGKTLCLAESCTGGLASQLITSVPGASDYYVGGVCSYARLVKEKVLGVDPLALAKHGAVSEVVARQMAEGARRALGADVALSFTGVAGPSGGSDEKPVGLVHFAIATEGATRAFSATFRGTRAQIQKRAVLFGFFNVRALLLENGP